MGKLWTMKHGEIITAPGNFDECLKGLSFNYDRLLEQNQFFQNELKRIRNEKWKDEELKKLKTENERLQTQLHNSGFYITPDEDRLIQDWIKNHNTHPLQGCAGGGIFSYIFTPTAIGLVKTIHCNLCGEEYTFSDY